MQVELDLGLPHVNDGWKPMATPLRHTTLGVLLGLVDIGVRESGGNNAGAQIMTILKNCDPPITSPAPWCAALIQFASDAAARGLNLKNPLDAVKLEAYVQSYADWGKAESRIIKSTAAVPGDLVLFSFGGSRYDHIGMMLTPVATNGDFETVEGNTSDKSQRDGDAVARKPRNMITGLKSPLFIRWTD